MSSQRADSCGTPSEFRLRVASSADAPPLSPADRLTDLPDLSLDPDEEQCLSSSGAAAHIVLDFGGDQAFRVHPAVRRLLRRKLDGRLPVTVLQDGRMEISFDVEDVSDETRVRVGAFAVALSNVFEHSSIEVRHRLLTLAPSEWAPPADR